MNHLMQGGTSQQGVNNGAVVVAGDGHSITVNNNANRISINATAGSIPIEGTNNVNLHHLHLPQERSPRNLISP